MPAKLAEYRLVADAGTLDQVIADLRAAGPVAIDTEFVRESTYFPQLCVLQIATERFVAAVDCLADIDLNLLGEALFDGGRTWVLHSARQDLEVVFNCFGRLPVKLIDTQIAAAMLGSPLQIGLQGLLSDLLGIALGKEHTRADWSRRPLSDEILQYALDDVRYLLPAWQVLSDRLADCSRLDWFDEDCRRQLEIPIQPDGATILERAKGTGSLRGRQRAAAQALVVWREQRAIQRDRPRRWILADEPLVAVAVALPQDQAELARIPGLPPKLIERSGRAILAAVHSAEPVPDPPESRAADKAVVKEVQGEVKALAEKLGIQPELLATRRDIAQAASGQAPAAFTAGWRSQLLGPLVARLSPDPAY
jgi:ribonuclease D